MFQEAITTVYSAIGTATLSFNCYPSDFKGTKSSPPYVKVSVLFPGNRDVIDYSFNKACKGILVFSIYVKTGSGQVVPATMATELDLVFQDKRLGTLQFLASSLSTMGVDSSDTSLSRTDYSIPFIFYGV